ncbi:DUF3027 domain-containing protein [Microbacterium esteraromaticum]|uniref:DUF3027 domain-containing protein n=1 Tax=Microbacterium esteraromaticum TaxID=57043 RepID=UPI0019578158|nr:DUF3027 domain-containing protein [Microbacterium esteraromaticum]MBM7465202.1 hypothetical protein [Microbacterium esteraromaticum]
MTSKPDDLAAATRDLALAALYEITPASTVGPVAGHTVEESGAVSLRFENRLPGYPGWFWTVTVAQVDDSAPTVLEVELMPGEGALLAPDWVPWAERLAEYRAHQAELAAQAEADAAESDSDASDDDSEDGGLDDDDESDEDEDIEDEDDVSPRLHAGDVDGVDIDELDEDESDDEDDDEDDEDSDSEDEDSDSEDEDSEDDESDDEDEDEDPEAEDDESE